MEGGKEGDFLRAERGSECGYAGTGCNSAGLQKTASRKHGTLQF